MNKIVEMPYGSHLYGTNTLNSDLDYKGVFLVDLEDVLINNVPKNYKKTTGNNNSKNTNEDIDIEFYSLHYFLQLGYKGETCFIDMVHCPESMLINNSDIWQFIRKNRSLFYTKNLKSLVGYCRCQAAKYGVRGSRLNDAKRVIDFLLSVSPRAKYLEDVWGDLPEGEHIKKIIIENVAEGVNPKAYDVCGRKFMFRTPIYMALDSIQHFHDNYGHRARMAAENKGIDWKAISHAFRAVYQLREILSTGDLIYPLQEQDFLTKVKLGQFHYKNDGIAEQLDKQLDLVNELSNKSTYPEKVNVKFWEDYLKSIYLNKFKNN